MVFFRFFSGQLPHGAFRHYRAVVDEPARGVVALSRMYYPSGKAQLRLGFCSVAKPRPYPTFADGQIFQILNREILVAPAALVFLFIVVFPEIIVLVLILELFLLKIMVMVFYLVSVAMATCI